jgi:hypothetical protein
VSAIDHPLFQSPTKSLWVYAFFLGPLSQGLNTPLKFKPAGSSHVIALFSLSSPPTIIRRIALVIINALKGITLRWARADIRNKVFKIAPSLADCNSASAVMMVRGVLGVMTSLAHGSPRAVFRRLVFVELGEPVCSESRRLNLSM